MEFIQKIRQRAKKSPKTIVLPEATDERVIKAAEIITKEHIAKIVLLVNKEKLGNIVEGIDLSGAEIIDPATSTKAQGYSSLLYELRKHKGMTMEKAKELVKNPIWFGT